MIDLTPLEVRKKKGDFRRGMRGYEPGLVDDFLDVVADRMEQLVRDNMHLKERTGRLEEQVHEYRERERALTEALVTAQEMREEMRQQTTREADLARREAETEAATILQAASHARAREEDALRRLRARQRQLLATYRAFLERELAELSVAADTLDQAGGEAAERPVAATAPAEAAEPQDAADLELTEADIEPDQATLSFTLEDER